MYSIINKKRLAILLIISIILSAIPVYGMEIGPDTEITDIASDDDITVISSSANWSEDKQAERERIMTSITNAVVSSMDENWSEVEKALYLANWLSNWVEYDKKELSGHFAESAIVDRKAVCEGFANAYECLMNKAGLFCIVVANSSMGTPTKEGYTPGHAWNLVRINGKYYYVDPTGTNINNLNNPFLFNNKFIKDEWERNGFLEIKPDYYEKEGKYYYGIGTEPYTNAYPDNKKKNIKITPCDIHNKLKICGDNTEEFLYKNLRLVSGNDTNHHKIYAGYSYFLSSEGTCLRYSQAIFNGANHTDTNGKKSKNNYADMDIHIYKSDGSEIDPSSYKITYKNCKNVSYLNEKKQAYFTIKWLQNTDVDPILTEPKNKYLITINPADISTLGLKYKSATVKNGQPKIKGLSFINECGKKISIKVLKNRNKSSSKSGCTATISDNTIVLEGHGNYTGTATIPLS